MEWIGYLVIGVVLCVIFWKVLKIDWDSEAWDTKLLIIVTPVAWPLVLIFVFAVFMVKKR